jgi:hypothetical protein
MEATEWRPVTQQDIFVKARLLAEGVRLRASGQGDMCWRLPEKEVGNLAGIESAGGAEVLRELKDCSAFAALECCAEREFSLDGCGLSVIVTPNEYSRLELVVEDGTDAVSIYDGQEVLVTGGLKKTHTPWAGSLLSNEAPIESALPFMTDTVINLIFHYACDNWNTGRACRYCNIFLNPVSKQINDMSLKTLREMAQLQAEAVKIVTDYGWRGNLAVTAGALPLNRREGYMERVQTVLDPVREAIGETVFSELNVIFNHYPPEDLSDFDSLKEMGINATSMDLEVMDPAYFAAICPGKHAYRPLEYWKEAQEAAADVFGPFTNTITGVVMGMEPTSLLIEGFEERLSKGVLPTPFVFFSPPGSAYEGFRPPTADVIVEASEKMAGILTHYAPQILQAAMGGCGERGAFLGNRDGSALTFPIMVVFDEFTRQLQEGGISLSADL